MVKLGDDLPLGRGAPVHLFQARFINGQTMTAGRAHGADSDVMHGCCLWVDLRGIKLAEVENVFHGGYSKGIERRAFQTALPRFAMACRPRFTASPRRSSPAFG